MKMHRPAHLLTTLALLALAAAPAGAQEVRQLTAGAFAFDLEVTLPGAPETIYDAITGDLTPWWDHKFSQSPARFVLEPKPGGGFWEIFDAAGDGVKHAEVIFAQRGKLLRFDGPLGLTGRAVQMVTTYEFAPAAADSTRLKVSVHVAGELDAGTPQIVRATWNHFIVERFKPYVESGRHLRR
jgi:uncharacterized protein YndB with AHSA1/START domain